MGTFAVILTIAAMIAVLAILFTGLISYARGGSFNARHGNMLMRYRVLAQGIALILFVIAMAIEGAT